MPPRLFLVVLTALCWVSGCSKEPEAALKETFNEAAPEHRQTANLAVQAFEQKDYPKAVVNLQILRSEPNMSAEQLSAVQDMMAQMQTQLAIRAEAGDAKAAEALRLLQMMPRR